MRHQHQAGFERFRHHFGGASRLQFIQLGIVLGAHQDRHIGAQAAHTAQDAQCQIGIGKADHQHTTMLQTHCFKNFSGTRITINHWITGLPRLLHALRVHVQRQIFIAMFFQRARQILTNATEAAQDHMIALRHRLCGSHFPLQLVQLMITTMK